MVTVPTVSGTDAATFSCSLTASQLAAGTYSSVDAVYATSEEALLTGEVALRTQLAGQVYSQLVPQVDSQVTGLEALHADDPPAERQGIDLLHSGVLRKRRVQRHLTDVLGSAGDGG